jgi:hypothetical protein
MQVTRCGKEAMRLLVATYWLMRLMKEVKKLSNATALSRFRAENAVLTRGVITLQLKQSAWTAGQVEFSLFERHSGDQGNYLYIAFNAIVANYVPALTVILIVYSSTVNLLIFT